MRLPKGLHKVSKSFKAFHGLKKKFIDLHKFEKILVLLVVFAALQIGVILLLSPTVLRESQSSVKAAAEKLTIRESKELIWTVTSKYGFQLTFDSNIFNAVGTVYSTDGKPAIDYSDEDILKTEGYAIVWVYPKDSKENSDMSLKTSIRKNFFEEKRAKYGKNLSDLELAVKGFEPIPDQNVTYKLIKQEKIKLNGIDYMRLDYTEAYTLFSGMTTESIVTTFVTVQNGRPYAVQLNYKSGKSPYYKAFLGITEKIKYSTPAKDATYISLNDEPSLTVFDRFREELVNKIAGIYDRPRVLGESTSTTQTDTSTIKVVATNMPAVVQIATIYCADISLVSEGISIPLGDSLCGGAFGSGFFVSADGYIGTNGHVVKLSPRDAIITVILLGDREVIGKIIKAAFEEEYGYPPSSEELNAVVDKIIGSEDALNELANIFAGVPESGFDAKNEKTKLAVQLGKESLRGELGGRESNSRFNYTPSVLEAKLVAYDFSLEDLEKLASDSNVGFTASDVALLKVEGKDFPFVKMGSIEGLVSGSEITVVGFPGLADNPLVETKESKATATRGIVSAIREAKGNKNKLIQSDVSIDHGNSGGPAFNSDGEVVGIATYGIPGEGGTFNYMRDIQDLKDLIAKHKVNLSKDSETQKVWESGLGKFLKSHYKSAVKDFTKVLNLYPAHVLAKEYTDVANQKIANDEDKPEAPAFSGLVGSVGKNKAQSVVLFGLVGLTVVTIGGIGVVVFLIMRRHKAGSGVPSQVPYGYPPSLVPTPGMSMPQWPVAPASQIPVPTPIPPPAVVPPVPAPPIGSTEPPPVPTYQPSPAPPAQSTVGIPTPKLSKDPPLPIPVPGVDPGSQDPVVPIPPPLPLPVVQAPVPEDPPLVQEPTLPTLSPPENSGSSTIPTQPISPLGLPTRPTPQVPEEPVSMTPPPDESIQIEPPTPTANAKKRLADLRSSLQQKVNPGGATPENTENDKPST